MQRRWKCAKWKLQSSHLKNIAVHKGLHYHSNFDVPYVVVVLKKCLCLLYCLICPLDFLPVKVKKPQPCMIQVHHSSARYLYGDSVSATMYVLESGQLAVKNWWGFRSGTKSQNRQIRNTTKFSRISYCKNKELKFGHRKFTVDIGTVPFCFVYTYIMVFCL